ncbi:MAG: hypothetical protein JXR19_10890 [Bacteroidia bacterium]
MKKLILLLLIGLSVEAMARPIVIIKQGGKRCGLFNKEVCYDYIEIKDLDDSYTQKCKGEGRNSCPRVGIVTIGGLEVAVDGLISQVEQAILNGDETGLGHLMSGGTVAATYSWQGIVNSQGLLEYRIEINEV